MALVLNSLYQSSTDQVTLNPVEFSKWATPIFKAENDLFSILAVRKRTYYPWVEICIFLVSNG